MVVLGREWLSTLPLSARVITDLMRRIVGVNDQEMNRIMMVTDEVKVLEEFRVIKLFLERQSGAGETGDKNDCGFGRIAGSVGPDLSAVLRLHELPERGHDEGNQVLMGEWGGETERGGRFAG